MKFAIIVLFFLPSLVNAASIVGVWKFEHKGQTRLLEIKEDSTYTGYEPFGGQPIAGAYYLLKDNSGLVFKNIELGFDLGNTAIVDIRELTEERLILQMLFAAAILERVSYGDSVNMLEAQENETQKNKRLGYIKSYLRQVAAAGQQYILEENVKSVSYDKLEGVYFAEIKPINGESYKDLVVHETGGTLKIVDKDANEYTYKY